MAETVTKTIGRVGPLDRGVYAPDTTYNAGDFVLYEESTYICKVDSTVDITPDENDNWQYFAKGIDPDTTEVTDKYGVTDSSPTPGGTSQKKTLLQTWIDSAADKIINKLLATDKFQDTLKQYLVNNGSTTGEGFALDARYGKTLQDSVNQLNSGISEGLVKIYELDAGSTTLEAYGSFNFEYEVRPYPVIDGYTCVGILGGHGVGSTGLQFSAGSVWVYNPASTQKTWTNVIFDLLYVKS